MADRFDAVVVGAGPAGSAAALLLARAGRSVCLLERGPFPGSKNMYGGVVYGRVLDDVISRWWDEIPVQRWVTRRATMALTPTQCLSVDVRSAAWGAPPYNGCTVHRSDFDSWLAGHAEAAGATLVCSTTATGLLRDSRGRIAGVHTDRAGGDVEAPVVIACDGVNSFLAKEAGLHGRLRPEHYTLGVKQVLALPRAEIERRFGLIGREGADIEIVGCTGDIPGGGFISTNLESVAVGVVLSLPALAASSRRPEEVLDAMAAHPAIAPYLQGGDLLELSAHLIPEGGYHAIPQLATDGLMVCGDAAGLCLAAGVWLEGVNFAIASGLHAARTADEALAAGDTSNRTLRAYPRRLRRSFVLADHRRLRRVPRLLMSERVQRAYPELACAVAEQVFTVDNTRPRPGLLRLVRRQAKAQGVRLRHVVHEAWIMARSFG